MTRKRPAQGLLCGHLLETPCVWDWLAMKRDMQWRVGVTPAGCAAPRGKGRTQSMDACVTADAQLERGHSAEPLASHWVTHETRSLLPGSLNSGFLLVLPDQEALGREAPPAPQGHRHPAYGCHQVPRGHISPNMTDQTLALLAKTILILP